MELEADGQGGRFDFVVLERLEFCFFNVEVSESCVFFENGLKERLRKRSDASEVLKEGSLKNEDLSLSSESIQNIISR